MKILITSVILMLMLSLGINAQTDFVIQKYNGSDHYVHIVEKGHTLYSISRLYKVDEDEIVKTNPEAVEGLSVGQTLYIPVNASLSKGDSWENPIRIEGIFLIHRVQKGETLFGIGSNYKVDINDILEDNPEANDGIKRKMELRIRMNQYEEVVFDEVAPSAQDSLQEHLVQPGETLFSISKKYKISIEDFKAMNNGLPDGLKAGEKVFVPGNDPLFVVRTQPVEFEIELVNKAPVKDGYNVAILLPLYLSAPDSAKDGMKQQILQSIGLELYRGISTGLDSLTKSGLHANVKVIDVYDNETALNTALKDPFLKQAHLIIGPLQAGPIARVADFASSYGIHLAIPVPQRNKILLNHPNMSKIVGSDDSEMKQLADFVAEQHFTDNVILLNSLFQQDARKTEVFKNRYNEELTNYPASSHTSVREIEAMGKSAGDIRSNLSLTMKNVIVLPSANESLIQSLMTKMVMLDQNKYDIVVYGSSEWKDMKILLPEYKDRFQISFPAAAFVDYTNEQIKSFVKNWSHKYNSDPGRYAFLGYDVMRYYGTGLAKFGLAFPNFFDEIPADDLLNYGFDFYQTGLESGFENKHFFILGHEDYELKLKESYGTRMGDR